jgi:ArsR family transcriptional regulator
MDRPAKSYDLALLFAALSDRTRLRLLNGREICVCYFVEILEQSQPKISRHLAYLRRAGVVAARREGKWMHYKITVPLHAGAARILRETLTVVREEKRMKTDLARLARACSALQRLCGLEAVPLPIQIGAAAWSDAFQSSLRDSSPSNYTQDCVLG